MLGSGEPSGPPASQFCTCTAAVCSVALISGTTLVHFRVLESPVHQSGSLPGYGEDSAWTSLLTFINLNFLLKILGFYLVYSFDDNFLTRKKNHLLFTFTACAIFLEELNENH